MSNAALTLSILAHSRLLEAYSCPSVADSVLPIVSPLSSDVPDVFPYDRVDEEPPNIVGTIDMMTMLEVLKEVVGQNEKNVSQLGTKLLT